MAGIAGFLRNQSITALLAAVIVAILVSAAWVGARMTNYYEEFITNAQKDQARELVKVAVDDLLWNRYRNLGIELAQSVATNKDLRGLIRKDDPSAIEAVLRDEFNQGLIAEGRVKLLGITAYDTEGAVKGEAWNIPPATPSDALMARVLDREGAERLESISFAWLTDETPLLSVFAPVGGLRLRGYVGVHLNPVPALSTLDARLGMAVRLTHPDSAAELASLSNVTLPEQAVTNDFSTMIPTRAGDPLISAAITADISDLVTNLGATRLDFLLLFIVVGGTAGVVGVAVTGTTLHRGRKREAMMRAQAEAAREAEVQERADNAARQTRLEEEKSADLRRSVLQLCDQLESDLESVVSAISSQTGNMKSSAGKLTENVDRISGRINSVSEAAGVASQNIQTVASATEQLAASSAEIGARVSESATIAAQAVDRVDASNGTVSRLAEAANKIGEVATLIQDIAEQTNLLALNATIEAARAGEAGKGFAVVASEVKNLATQTAQATEEIGGQIKAIQGAGEEAVAAIGQIGTEITNINEVVTAIASAVEEQSAATQEIARNSQQASSGIGRVSENAQGTSEDTAEVVLVAREFEGSTNEVSNQIEQMLVRIKGVLSETRQKNGG